MARSPSPEKVTDLIAKPPAEYVPEPRYVSRYRDKIRKAAKRGKSAHKTLGVPNVVLNPPGEFLRKRSVIRKRPEVHHEHYHKPGYQHKLPDWQPIKASEKDAQLSQTRVDFTKRNIDEARNLRPHKPRKFYVDDRHGTVHALKPSGLYPTYRNRKSFGQVPGANSPTMARSEPMQKNRGASPQRERNVKAKKIEDRHVTHEINSPRRHEDRRDNRAVKGARKSVEKRDRSNVKSARKREEKQSKDSDKFEGRHRDQKNGKKYSERADKDEKKDADHEEDGGERNLERKYDDEEDNREDADETKIEITSLKSSNGVRKSASHDRREEELSSRGSVQQPRCRYVTEDERNELLYGMKKKWDEMMKKFQCLPFLTDTPPKAARKSAMEKDLLQLEKDIQIIERHPYIYVYSDSEDGY